MTDDALILIGREGTHDRETLRTHALRLERRGVADAVRVLTYEEEPGRELRDDLRAVAADRVFAFPAFVAHTHETTDVLPGVLSYVQGDVRYCEPVGRSPALTSLILRRASDLVTAGDDASLVLVGFGNSSQPYHRQTAEYHAARIAEQSAYEEVVTCYLLQNPAAECVRYNVTTDRAVAVPLFLTRNDATTEQIPAKLELGRGGIEYADPFGDHPLLTDAIHAEVARQRVLADREGALSTSFEEGLVRGRRPVATDGEGVIR